MQSILFALVADESGQGVAEYAMLLGGISLSMILTITALGVNLGDVYAKISRNFDQLPTTVQQ